MFLFLAGVMASCLVPSRGESDNYMAISNTFASIASIEDLILPEGEMMRALEGYHGQLKENLNLLER